MCTPKWRCILVHWINCLQDIEIKELKELADGAVLLTIIGQLASTNTTQENFKTVEQFLRTKYPTFDWPEDLICDGGGETITTAVTLLMHYACVRSKNVDIRNTMCAKLTAVEQQTIMQFNTFIMKNSLETSEDLRLATVYACGEDLESSGAGDISPESQAMSEATPPATRLLHDQRMEIRRIRADLDAERFDRTYLQDELKRLQQTTKKLMEDREKSQKHISLLKSLLESARSPESPKSEKFNNTSVQTTQLGRQLQELEDRLVNVQLEMGEVTKERDSFKTKLESMRLEKEKWLERASEQSVRAERALEQVGEQREQVSALQEQVADLRAHLLRSRDLHDSSAMMDTDDFDSSTRFRSAADFSAISEDLCTNVVEVQLSEQRVICVGLQNKLDAVKEDLAKMTNEKDIVVEANEMLCEKIKMFETDHTDLQNIVRNQQALLLAQMEHLHAMSLNVQSKCENEINKILTELNHLLTDSKTQIVDNFQQNVKLLLRINNVATQLINELQCGNDEKNVVITHLRRNVDELKEALRICESEKKYLSEGVETIMGVNDTVINKKCAEKIDELKNRIDVLNSLIKALSVKTKSVCDAKNMNIQKLLSELESETQKSNSLEVKCDEIISETNGKIKSLEKHIIVTESNICELNEKNCNLENKLKHEIEQRKCVECSFSNAEEKIRKMEIDIESKEIHISKLGEEQFNLGNNLKELENKLLHEVDHRSKVEHKLEKKTKENVDLQNCITEKGIQFEEECVKLKHSIDDISRLFENENLQKKLLESKCQNLEEQITNLEKDIGVKEIDIRDCRDKYNILQGSLEDEISLGKGLKINCGELQKETENLKTELKCLEHQLEERKNVQIQLEEAEKKMRNRILLYENDLSKLGEERCTLKSNLKDLANNFEQEIKQKQTVQMALEKAEEKIQSVEKELTLKDEHVKELEEKHNNLKTKMVEWKNELEAKIREKKTVETELIASRDEVEILKKEVMSKQKDLADFREVALEMSSHNKNVLEKMNVKLVDMQERLLQVTTDSKDEKSAFEKNLENSEKNIREKDAKITNLSHLLKLEKDTCIALNNKLSELEIKNSSLNETISTLNTAVIDLQNCRKKYDDIISTLEQERNEFSSRVSALRSNLSVTENNLTKMSEEKIKFEECFNDMVMVLENERFVANQTVNNLNKELISSKNIINEMLHDNNYLQSELESLKQTFEGTEMVLNRERDVNVENVAKLRLDIATHEQRYNESVELLRVELMKRKNAYEILSDEYEKQKQSKEMTLAEKISLENDIENYKKHIFELVTENKTNLEVINKNKKSLSVRRDTVNEYIEATFNLNNQIYILQEAKNKLSKDLESEKNLVRKTAEENRALKIKYDDSVKKNNEMSEKFSEDQNKQRDIIEYIKSEKSEIKKNLAVMTVEVKENQRTVDLHYQKLQEMEKKLDAKMADVVIKEKLICIQNNVVTEFKKQVEELETSLSKLTEDKLLSEKDLVNKKSEITQLNSLLTENARENNDLYTKLEQIKQIHSKLLLMFVYDKEDLAKVTKEKVDLEKQVELTKEKLEKLLEALENEQKINTELNMKLEKESNSKIQSEGEKHELIEEIKLLKKNSEELLENLEKERSNWDEKVNNLEMNLASNEGALFTVLQEKNEISVELNRCKKDYDISISGLQQEINEKSELITMLGKKLSVEQKTLQEKNEELKDLTHQCDKISSVLEANEQELNFEVDSILEKEKLISELENKNEELLVTLKNKTDVTSRLEEEVSSKMQLLSNIVSENEMLRNELKRCEEFEVKYENVTLIKEKMVNEHKKELSELEFSLESKLSAEVKIRKDVESKFQELMVSYEKNKTDHSRIVSDLNKLLDDVKEESEGRAARIESLEELLEERTSEFNSLLAKLDALTEEQDQLEDGNVETIHDYEEQLCAKTKELQILESEMASVVQEKNSMENKFNEIHNEVLKSRKEIDEKTQEIENVCTQNCDLRLKYEQLMDNKQNEIQSCKEKNENLTEEMNSLRLCNEKLQAEIDQQTNHSEKINADFVACQIDVENMKITNSELAMTISINCKEIEEFKSRISSLQKNIDDLRREKDDSLRKFNKMKEILSDKEETMSTFIDKFSAFIASIDEEGKNYDEEKEIDVIVGYVERILNQVSEMAVAENVMDTVESTTSERDPGSLIIKLRKVMSQIISMKKENLERNTIIDWEETCKIEVLSEKINILNDSLFKRNNEIEQFLNMLRDKDAEILHLNKKAESFFNEIKSLKEEQRSNVEKLETLVSENNCQITNTNSEVTHLKTIIAESENKLTDVNKELTDARDKLAAVNKEKNDAISYLQQQSAKLQEKLARKEDGSETIKLSAKLQSLVHQWNMENRNTVALQELTHLSNITNDENSTFENRNIFDRRNSTFKSESSVTLEQLEALLESSVKRDKLSSDRINLLQQEREHLKLQNKSFKNENESLKKTVLALKEQTNTNENTQSVKCLNELSAYFRIFTSVRNSYKSKLQKINSIQKLIRKELSPMKKLSPESVTPLEKQYLINIEETFDIVLFYADWTERGIDQSISSLKLSPSSLNISDVQNITLEIQLDQLVSTLSNLLEQTGKLRMGVESGPPVPSRRNLAGTQSDPNEVHRRVSEVRAEYEDKLTRMKEKMKQLYQEQIAVYKERQNEELCAMEKELCKERTKLAERTKAYEQHVATLTDELWKVGEKLLVEKNEADWLRKKRQSSSLLSLQNTSSATSHSQRGVGRPSRAFDTQSLRSVRESEKSESGGLHMSDEEGEVFDNRWLKELSCTPKAVGQTNSAIDSQRYSELRWRNSLCPPHLKSSYPAETQFHNTATYAEQDIKSEMERRGGAVRKEVGITAYKKPGPPTPGKNAGRLSATDSELRESIRSEPDAAVPKKNGTPSRLKSLLGMATSRTEHDTTPKSRRLSIFRKNR